MEWMQGKKTYFVALGVIVASAVGFAAGDMSLQEAINSALVGLGLGTLRAGVAKS